MFTKIWEWYLNISVQLLNVGMSGYFGESLNFYKSKVYSGFLTVKSTKVLVLEQANINRESMLLVWMGVASCWKIYDLLDATIQGFTTIYKLWRKLHSKPFPFSLRSATCCLAIVPSIDFRVYSKEFLSDS